MVSGTSQPKTLPPRDQPHTHPPPVVCVRYCDGGSWTGARTDPVMVNGTALWFRGRANIDAQFDDLSTQFGFNKATEVGASRLSPPPPPPLALSYTAPSSHTLTQVLLGGGSAGALASYLHANYVADNWIPASVTRLKVGVGMCVGRLRSLPPPLLTFIRC